MSIAKKRVSFSGCVVDAAACSLVEEDDVGITEHGGLMQRSSIGRRGCVCGCVKRGRLRTLVATRITPSYGQCALVCIGLSATVNIPSHPPNAFRSTQKPRQQALPGLNPYDKVYLHYALTGSASGVVSNTRPDLSAANAICTASPSRMSPLSRASASGLAT